MSAGVQQGSTATWSVVSKLDMTNNFNVHNPEAVTSPICAVENFLSSGRVECTVLPR